MERAGFRERQIRSSSTEIRSSSTFSTVERIIEYCQHFQCCYSYFTPVQVQVNNKGIVVLKLVNIHLLTVVLLPPVSSHQTSSYSSYYDNQQGYNNPHKFGSLVFAELDNCHLVFVNILYLLSNLGYG